MSANTSRSALDEALILSRLESLIDPEVGINVVDLGLIENIAFPAPDTVKVTMLVTSPGCPLRDTLARGAHNLLSAVPGIREVEVEVADEPAWTPHRIRPGALD